MVAAGEDAAASLDTVTALLKRHGAPVTAKPDRARAGAGATLLDAAAAERADLLVMGAYGHSRLREIVLGRRHARGATRRQDPGPAQLLSRRDAAARTARRPAEPPR